MSQFPCERSPLAAGPPSRRGTPWWVPLMVPLLALLVSLGTLWYAWHAREVARTYARTAQEYAHEAAQYRHDAEGYLAQVTAMLAQRQTTSWSAPINWASHPTWRVSDTGPGIDQQYDGTGLRLDNRSAQQVRCVAPVLTTAVLAVTLGPGDWAEVAYNGIYGPWACMEVQP